MKGIMSWPGFKSVGVPYERGARSRGNTTWNYWKLWNFALDGLTGFSTVPLRLWIYVGATVALISFVFSVFVILEVLTSTDYVPGIPSVLVAISFFSGVQILTLGLIGEYLGRLFEEAKGRPIYIVDSFEE